MEESLSCCTDAQAVHSRQIHIQQYQLRRCLTDALRHGLRTAELLHTKYLVALSGEKSLQFLPDHPIIFHNYNFRHDSPFPIIGTSAYPSGTPGAYSRKTV